MIDRPPAQNGSVNGGTSGRVSVSGLRSPHPLGSFLPALFQEDDFTQRWTAGLDMVLAPIFSSLDNFEAYLDPMLTPADFLDWLGTWMGLVADETWDVERRRTFVSEANALYRMRGTPRGLAAHVQIFTGGEVEIVEHGAAAASQTAGAALPGTPGFDFTVRVTVDDPAAVDTARLEALVAAAKPAHLAHRVEVVAKSQPRPRQVRRTVTPVATDAPGEGEGPAEQSPAPERPGPPEQRGPADGADGAPPEGEPPAAE